MPIFIYFIGGEGGKAGGRERERETARARARCVNIYIYMYTQYVHKT